MLQRLHHIGVAVLEMEAALRTYVDLLGGCVLEREESPDLEIVFVRLGDATLELMAPRRPGTVLERFLERRGEGLHHLAYAVEQADGALAALSGRGLQPLDRSPRPGSGGSRIAFFHPRSAHGVLLEIVEPAPAKAEEAQP